MASSLVISNNSKEFVSKQMTKQSTRDFFSCPVPALYLPKEYLWK